MTKEEIERLTQDLRDFKEQAKIKKAFESSESEDQNRVEAAIQETLSRWR